MFSPFDFLLGTSTLVFKRTLKPLSPSFFTDFLFYLFFPEIVRRKGGSLVVAISLLIILLYSLWVALFLKP